ncbi:S4 domain-containing protein YaaA [Vaginisenegalia massiliensis]|uniref:S4 domain-containing protein YaaA n=1 Tax=Vaginisenegalia massiliensis TaxID=2058294 RepID=UPI000F538097|nr:S4 domain-containing protein YaaA [Vaginisenegalia massiliensis]
MTKKLVEINDSFITLGQLLKHESIIGSGGMAKWYLAEHTIYVNDEPENRRGKKLSHGDCIHLVDEDLELTIHSTVQTMDS